MLQTSLFSVSYVSKLLKVFHMDAVKVDRDVTYVARSVPNVLSAFSDVCCKYVYLDVAYVSHICYKCFICMLRMFIMVYRCFQVFVQIFQTHVSCFILGVLCASNLMKTESLFFPKCLCKGNMGSIFVQTPKAEVLRIPLGL
jgi:hypothetical protein